MTKLYSLFLLMNSYYKLNNFVLVLIDYCSIFRIFELGVWVELVEGFTFFNLFEECTSYSLLCYCSCWFFFTVIYMVGYYLKVVVFFIAEDLSFFDIYKNLIIFLHFQNFRNLLDFVSCSIFLWVMFDLCWLFYDQK